jgi:hypothetical protein
MSSLVTTASIWNNDDSAPKKRQSTMRKTIKLRSDQQLTEDVGEYDETTLENEKYGKMSPSTIDDQQNYNSNRNQRVNELLNKITSADTTSDNNKLGNFKPMSPPSLNVKRDMETSDEVKQYVPPMPSYLKATIDRANGQVPNAQVAMNYGYGPKDYSNYQQSYGSPLTPAGNKPYYSNMGIGSGTGSGNDKLMEKINYMIHLLEESQSERTNNITEEFILYTFLGIFVIFVVDSFSRTGKYVR